MDKNLSEGDEEKVNEVLSQAKRIEAKTEKLLFLTNIKRIGVVLGGALLFVGFLLLIGALLIIFEILDFSALLGLPPLTAKLRILFSLAFTILGILDVLGGLTLAGK